MQPALPSQQTIGGMLKSPRLLIFAGVVAFFAFITAWYTHSDPETLGHFCSRSFAEARHIAYLSYTGWNPRIGEFVFHFCDYAIPFYILGPILFSLFLVIGPVAIYRLGIGHLPDSSCRSIFTLALITTAVLGFHSCIYWFIANYNWYYASILAVCFIITVEPWFRGDFAISWKRCAFAIPLAFVSGMSQENTPAAIIVLLLACGGYWFILKKQRKGIGRYALIMAFLLIGAYLLYSAPGRTCRTDSAHWELSFENILFNSILFSGNWIYFLICFWRPFMVGGLLIVFSLLLGRRMIPGGRTKILIISFCLLWSVLILAPWWGAPRGYMPMDIILLCILGRQVYQLFPKIRTCEKLILCSTQLLLSATIAVPIYISSYSTHRNWEYIVEKAEECKQRGESILVLRRSEFDLSPITLHDLPIPKLVFPHEVRGEVPLNSVTKQQYAEHKDVWIIPDTFDLDLPQVRANKSVAKHLGLESIFYIRD